jgi:hypothetical protein
MKASISVSARCPSGGVEVELVFVLEDRRIVCGEKQRIDPYAGISTPMASGDDAPFASRPAPRTRRLFKSIRSTTRSRH